MKGTLQNLPLFLCFRLGESISLASSFALWEIS